MARLTARRVAYAAATAWFNGLFYRRTLGGRRARGLVFAPQDGWPGDARRGAALLGGEYLFAGHSETAPADLWRARAAGPEWRAELHGFDWLRDVRAVGGETARRQARALVLDWLVGEDRWRPLSWRPAVLGRRVAAWLASAAWLFPPDEATDAGPFLRSLERQVTHLRRVAALVDRGLDRLLVLRGLVHAGVCVPGQARDLPRWLDALSAELGAQIAEDGCHLTRSPAVQLALLQHLVELRALLRDAGLDAPPALDGAVSRMARALRGLRHGDGALCLFNHSNEHESWLIDLVLRRSGAGGVKPVEAAASGFQRLTAQRALVLIDAGPPPPPGFDAQAHAGTLSFEMSVGRQRLIVNCGAYEGPRADWLAAQRTTPAHSTVTIDDLDSAELRGGARIGARPRVAAAERRERGGDQWLDAALADYGGVKGLGHRRRLYLSASGADLRGEDVVASARARRFAARFHLHPSVTASLAQGGGSVLLRLGDGGGWRLRASGGAVGLRESLYLGLRGEVKRTEQVVVEGATEGGEARIKWALTRLDG